MRTAILNCAAEAFSQREFHEVLTDDIALKLGIGKGTLYRYFDSKEDLYFATIVRGLDGMHEALTAVLERAAPMEQTIETIVCTMLEYFWNRRDFFVLLYRMEPKLDPRERAEWQERRDDVITRVAHLLRQGAPTGSVAREDARLAVELLLGMIRSICLYRTPSDTMPKLARTVARVFLRGVISPRSGQRATQRAGSRPLRILSGK